jgi:1-acyl-sn-glycerol-3-phosphate acyltransferase
MAALLTGVQWVLSLIFIAQMYLMMAVFAIVGAIPSIFSRGFAVMVVRGYAQWVVASARILLGLKVEVRGTVPKGGVLVAAKHQSFFDIIVLFAIMPNARFIMKRELIYTPFLGQYALRIGCVPIDRSKRGGAIGKMKSDVARTGDVPGQLVIYPQGTRVPPGEVMPYKVGAGLLYAQLGQTCHPMATNIGLFWPKRGILRKRGTTVVQFLDTVPPGLSVGTFMRRIESEIEAASNLLLAEARA